MCVVSSLKTLNHLVLTAVFVRRLSQGLSRALCHQCQLFFHAHQAK